MESKKQSVNTFIKGMDKDIDISFISKESYIDAHNFRLVTSTGNTSMSLEVIDGNSLIQSLPTGWYINGYCNVRNILVIFITNNSNSKILTSNISDGNLSYFTTIYSDDSTPDGSLLNFNTSYPIQAIGRYESSLVQKVYFADGLNNLRFFNLIILKNQYTIGINQVVNQFDIIPNFTLSCPQFQSLTYGNLTAGKIQYAYQLYNQYGAETLFSPCSSLISLSDANFSNPTNKLFGGDAIGTNTGKGVIFTVPNFSGYSKIRIISILYTQLNGVPSINIIAEENLPSTSITGNLTFTDFGTVSLGTYTYEELAIVGRYLFIPQTIETKNNYLFAGNVTQEQWDITYDARAYRFPTFGAEGILNPSNYAMEAVTAVFDSLGNPFLIEMPNLTTFTTIPPLTHDCINPYNNIALDGLRNDNYPSSEQYYNFMYNAGGVLGGNGPNVSYTFTTSNFILDNNVSNGNEMTVTYPYDDFSNPSVEISSKGYQRDEIYRFGIVFYDGKGRQSTVKWIGDIRFPNNINVYPIVNTILDSLNNVLGSQAINIGIKFSISNLSSVISAGAVSYQIVRCKRTSTDRTVIAQGFTLPLEQRSNSAGSATYLHLLSPDQANIIDPGQTNINYKLLEFISPEVNINQNINYSSGDRLDVISQLSTCSTWSNQLEQYYMYWLNLGSGGGNDNNSWVYKYYGCIPVISQSIEKINIDAIYLTDPINNGDGTGGLNIGLNYLYNSTAFYGNNGGFPTIGCNIGTKLILKLDTALTTTPGYSNSIFGGFSYMVGNVLLCNYRRLNGTTILTSPVTTQYGGNTYYDRQNCSYIECSNIFTCSSSTTTNNVFSGDTYICMYDYLRNIVSGTFAQSNQGNGNRSQLILYYPTETSINLRYRSDTSFSKINENIGISAFLYMTEKEGSYGHGFPYLYNQPTDLYLYNSVYSQEDTTITFFPKNDNIIYGNQTFDSRIVVSEKKINGEVTDSWLQFDVNNFLDTDTGYGPVNSLLQYNDHLFFFQDNAFGDISVSPRSLLSDNNPGSLVLGTGAVLDRYDYISTTIGNKFKFGNIIGLNGIYWYDVPSKTIYNYSGSTKPLSKLKGLFSYFTSFGDESTSCIAGYDYKYNEVLFTLKNSLNNYTTVSYSELADAFISFYDYTPGWYINVYNKQLYTVPINSFPTYGGNTLWLQNSGLKCNLYGYITYQYNPYVLSSSLTYAINDNFQQTKIFDSITYNTKSKLSNGNDNFSDTFNEIQCWNTKQNTGKVNITVDNPTVASLTLTDNTFKREGNFITTLPRNIVSSSAPSNVNIFTYTNWNSSRLFQERLRDKYLLVQLTYNNLNGYTFSVPFITNNYRISNR